MGLKCLLGHDFGEAEIEREREEDGDQMVVTIRELKTCQRCGTERVISENKEVTSIRSAEEIGLDAGEDADETASAEEGGTESDRTETTDAERVDAGADSGRGGTDAASSGPTDDASPASDDSQVGDASPASGGTADLDEQLDDPESDDGVILPEEDQQREHGEWPDAEHAGGDTAQGRTDRADSDVADGAEQPAADAESSDAAPSADADADHESQTATDDDPTAQADTAAKAEPAVADGEREDVEIIGDDADEDAGDADATADVSGVAESNGDTGTPAADDAEITTGRESGREPLAGDEDETTAWPDHGGEDEGFDAEVGSAKDVSFSGNGLTPDVDAETPDSDAEYVETDTQGTGADDVRDRKRRVDVDTGIAREDSPSIDLSEMSDDTKFYCPNCGLTRSSGESSMRAGDICPECRKGYIAEREG